MNYLKNLTFTLLLLVPAFVFSQTVDQILNNYFKNIGGVQKLEQLKGIKMYTKVNQNGMEIPLEIIQMKDGRQMTIIKYQGNDIRQGVFDGETLWADNFMTMKAEKKGNESTENMKLEANDFPSPFLNYKKKHYQVELIGKDTIDGVETFKIKLIREPISLEGKKIDNVSFYYFDTQKFLPIAVESEIQAGQMKGMMTQVKMSDYRDVEGISFPFAMSQGIKGQGISGIAIEKIEINPEITDEMFKFPGE